MSIKAIHILFISTATVVAFGFAAWSARNGYSLAVTSLSALAGLGLILYGVAFYQKIKHLP